MSQALAHRFGARDFDIDTMQGWVKFRIYESKTINLGELADAMTSASYNLRSVAFEAKGKVEATATGHDFVIEGTGQRFHIAGEGLAAHVGNTVKLHLRTDAWAETAPVMQVED